jgi:hypothetical protein
VQYDVDLAERCVEPGRVRELEGAVLEAERVGDGFELCLVAAGEDRREALSLAVRAVSFPVKPVAP